jgi:hypothetical protein
MPSTKIAEYLLSLSRDPTKIKAFTKNPTAEMTKAGLSASERSIVSSKDPGRIQNAITGGLSKADGDNVVVVVVVL